MQWMPHRIRREAKPETQAAQQECRCRVIGIQKTSVQIYPQVIHKICILILILVPTLPMCVAILAIAFRHWRKHPSFINILNFKRSCWFTLFISIGMTALGIAGVAFIPTLVFKFDLLGLSCLPFVALMFAGAGGCIASSIYCLWHLIAAFFSYVRTKQNNN